MKKVTIIAALAMVACLSAFTFSGCGGSKTESTTSDASSQESKKEEKTKENGKFNSIEECVADPEFKEAFEGADTDEYTFEIKGEGDSLVYEYTYKEVYEDGEALDAMKENLESASSTDSVNATMVNIANTLKDYVNVEKPSVVMRYLNGDGTLIYEAKYEADAE